MSLYVLFFCQEWARWFIVIILSYSKSSSSSSSSSCSSKYIQKQFCVMWVEKYVPLYLIFKKKTNHIRSKYGVGEGMCFVCVPAFLCLLCCLYCRNVHSIIHQGVVLCAHYLLLMFFLFVPYFFIFLPSMLFRRVGHCFPFDFLLGILH